MALYTLFGEVDTLHVGAIRLSIPRLATLDWRALVIAAAAMVAMFRFRAGVMPTLGPRRSSGPRCTGCCDAGPAAAGAIRDPIAACAGSPVGRWACNDPCTGGAYLLAGAGGAALIAGMGAIIGSQLGKGGAAGRNARATAVAPSWGRRHGGCWWGSG